MRISACTLAYNDEGTISGTIKCLKPFVERHIVLISDKPYFGQPSPPDRTEEICENHDVEVVHGNWKLDHFQRTLGNQLCKDFDWVLGFDSDEMMTNEELEKFIDFLGKTDAPAVGIRPEVYWYNTAYVLRPIPDYAPIIAMRPNVKFTYIRNIDSPFTIYDGTMHHLSWCKPKDIWKKITNYAHASDFANQREWFDKHYMGWREGQKAVMPDGSEFTTLYKPLPEELKRYL